MRKNRFKIRFNSFWTGHFEWQSFPDITTEFLIIRGHGPPTYRLLVSGSSGSAADAEAMSEFDE